VATVVAGPAQATVSISATDATSGVASISYAVNGSTPVPYMSPIVITAPGVSILTFSTTDLAGNSEAQHSVTVTVTGSDSCSAPVVDTFNRANGQVGANWVGATGIAGYAIASNRLQPRLGGPLLWRVAGGTNQSVAMTLSAIDPIASQGLLLKAQSELRPEGGAISVVYDPVHRMIVVSAIRTGQLSWTFYPAISATLAAGDRLGACATSAGDIRVYRNSILLQTVRMSTSDRAFFNGRGGRMGVWTLLATRSAIDDFAAG
jgi:hypothetical protein